MHLYIKQRMFTRGDQFSGHKETGNKKNDAEDEILTFGKKLQ